MTNSIISIMTLLTFLGSMTIHGQELVKKKKYKDGLTEEFFVLKNDKNIRQGPALTTYNDILDKKYIAEFGQYDLNKKSGTWLTFYFIDPGNSLKSIGSFKDDLKEGYWRYYYPRSSSGILLKQLSGTEKSTKITETKKSAQTFQIEFDTTGQQITCTGEYRDDKKIGIWDYYSKTGYLLQRYNHDSSEFLQNNIKEPNNDFLVYLGGPERFYNYYFMEQQEIKINPLIKLTSEVIYEIDNKGNYKLISSYGDENFKIQVDQILKTIPGEWICLNNESSKKLQLISKIVVNDDSFTRFKYSMEYKVID
jgi:antitoxin component YwqK of YwqJK toxin-antitoxin module